MGEESKTKRNRIVLIVVLLVIISLALTCGLLVHFLATSPQKQTVTTSPVVCSNECVFTLVESIPDGMTYPDNETVHQATGPTVLNLIQGAQETIHVASSYWTLRTHDISPTDPVSSQQGQDVFDALQDIGKKGKVKVKIVQDQPTYTFPDNDTQVLNEIESIEVRSINFRRLIGAGILHTKLWLVDGRHFYVGSANMDWRSYTQVKEMGVLVQNCSCLAADMAKIFQVYWDLAGDTTSVPNSFSSSLSTEFNVFTPLSLVNNTGDANKGSVYLSGRTTDIDSILNVISKAEKFVYIAVMDYLPIIMYSSPNRYWPVIDDALRTTAFDNNVTVRLLVSYWNHSRADMFVYLQSLAVFSKTIKHHTNLEVKIFEVPANSSQASIPFTRVNHNKYMVTEKHAYIGTSNWSGDYFVSTGGIGFIMEQPKTIPNSSVSIRQQLEDVFHRDWNSVYTHSLSNYVKLST